MTGWQREWALPSRGPAMRYKRQRLRNALLASFIYMGWVASSVPAHAHQDTLFPISPDGTLLQVPDQYGPIVLEIGSDGDPPVVGLRIGSRQIDLPPCIAALFSLPAGEAPRATGSWYHSRSTLPPYLNLQLPRQALESGYFSGYSLLFNLETAELIEIREHTTSVDQRMSTRAIAPGEICTTSEIQQLEPVLLASLSNPW